MSRRHTFPVVFALVLGALAAPSAAAAQTITVNSGRDVLADDGTCTLREAVLAANSDTASGATPGECPAGQGGDDVVVGVPLATLSLTGREETAGRTGDLNVTSNLTLEGAGAGATTVDAGGVDRVLQIAPGATVTVRSLTLTGGVTAAGADAPPTTGTGTGTMGGAGEPGGGIENAGVLTLVGVAVSGNRTGRGGIGGDRSAPQSTFEAGGDAEGGAGGVGGPGGGIHNAGTLVVSGSTITANTTGDGGAGGRGIGGDAAEDGGAGGRGEGGFGLEGGDGGGIDAAGPTTIVDSSVTANTTGRGGASGAALGGAGTTVAHGDGGRGGPADAGIAGSGGGGAGIAVVGATDPAVTIADSLIRGNATGPGGPGMAAFGGVGSAGGADGGPGGAGGAADGGQGGIGGVGGGVFAVEPVTLRSVTVAENTTGNGGAGGVAFGGPGGRGVDDPGGAGGNGRGGDGGRGGRVAAILAAGTVTNATIVADHGGATPAAGGEGTGGLGGTGTPDGLPGGSNRGAPGISPSDGVVAGFLSVHLRNSVLSGNAPASCGSEVVDGGDNVAFPDSTCSGAQVVDPGLLPLGDHGGPTPTYALQALSPAVDRVAATGAGCPPTDQRGVARPQGLACDAGAYELAPPGVVTGGALPATTSASVMGTVDPHLRATTVHVEFGRTAAYGSVTPPRGVGAGNTAATVPTALGGLTAGTTYHYRLVATNGDGTSVGSDRTFTTFALSVVQPPGGGGGGGVAARPMLTHLRLKPARFRPVTRRHHRHRGTRITYRDTKAARTAFVVEQLHAGVERGGRCVAPHRGRAVAKARRCHRLVRLKGAFHHTDRVGADHLHWSGRLRGRPLAPGAYRLLARPAGGARIVHRFRIRG